MRVYHDRLVGCVLGHHVQPQDTAHAVAYKSYSDKVAIDCSAGKTYLFDSNNIGKHYYMTNLVKERGYSIGAIAANPNYGYKFSAAGVWSPDNVNKY